MNKIVSEKEYQEKEFRYINIPESSIKSCGFSDCTFSECDFSGTAFYEGILTAAFFTELILLQLKRPDILDKLCNRQSI